MASARDLIKDVSSVYPQYKETVKKLVVGQYNLASKFIRRNFIKDLHVEAASLFDEPFLVSHVGKRPRNAGRTVAQSVADRPSMYKDVRLIENPQLETVQIDMGFSSFPPLPSTNTNQPFSPGGSFPAHPCAHVEEPSSMDKLQTRDTETTGAQPTPVRRVEEPSSIDKLQTRDIGTTVAQPTSRKRVGDHWDHSTFRAPSTEQQARDYDRRGAQPTLG